MFATTGERVLVIGGAGALGSLTADVFEDSGWDVVRAGRRPNGTGDWLHVDLDEPETIVPGLASVDVVVNTVPHPELTPERLVLEHGGVLLNTSAVSTRCAAGLSAIHADARGTVVTGAGIAPGVTNLVAAQLLDAYPEADELELVFTFSIAAGNGSAGSEFVHRHLTSAPSHTTVEVPLESFGTRECIGFAEGELGWIGELAGSRRVRTYACFAEPEVHETLLALNRQSALGTLPRPRPRPRAVGREGRTAGSEPVAHWISVRRAGRRLAARTIRCSGDYRAAAHATLALAQSLQDARARARLPPGAFSPEQLVDLRELAPYLATAGIAIVETRV